MRIALDFVQDNRSISSLLVTPVPVGEGEEWETAWSSVEEERSASDPVSVGELRRRLRGEGMP